MRMSGFGPGLNAGDPAPGAPDMPMGSDLADAVDRPSLLILGNDAELSYAGFDLASLGGALGFRLLDCVSIGAAAARLAMLVDVDAVIVRCTGQEAGLDLALARLDMMASASGTRLLALADLGGLDLVHATLRAPGSLILCEPDDEELVAGLAVLAADAGPRPFRLHDIGRDPGDARLEQINDQLARLSRTIEALMQNRTAEPAGTITASPSPVASMDILPQGAANGYFHAPARAYAAQPAGAATPAARRHDGPVSAPQVRAVLRARRLRDQLVASDLFADPAWDILLDLMAARLEGSQVSVSSLCIAAAVPPTTALRWIRQLTDRGLLVREADPDDGRRVFIALSDAGAGVVSRWFEESRGHMLAALGR